MFCLYISLNINEIFCTFEQKIIDFICSSSAHTKCNINWQIGRVYPKKKRVELWDEIVSQREREVFFFLMWNWK